MRDRVDIANQAPPCQPRAVRRALWLLAGMALLSTGCMRGQARTLPQAPLNVPAAPPRVVEVVEPPESLIISLPEEPVTSPPPRPRLTPTPRPDRQNAEPRPEPEVPRPAEEAAKPTPSLQTAPAQQEGEAERRIRLLLAQATGDLNRINMQTLNADARQQFDTARRFVTQAEEALRSRNLVFATNLADKAAALASQLANR
jgi:hypothetical protein